MNNIQISNLPLKEWQIYKKMYFSNKKNFDFNSRFEMMKSIKNISEKYNFKLFLTDGCLLGAYREKNFISWDNDVEFCAFDEEINTHFDNIVNDLLKENFIVRTIKEYPNAKINSYFKGEKVGILSLYKKSDIRYRHLYKWPASFFDNSETINFKNEVFSCPKIEDYLEYQYGLDWKIPKKNNYLSKDVFL